MIRNYLTVAVRHFRSNRYSIATISFGLAIGIACSIIAYLNWEFHNSYDAQHTRASLIHKVHTIRNIESDSIEFGIAPAVLGSMARASIPGITTITRYMKSEVVTKLDEKVIRQEMAYADPSFMRAFDFTLIHGSLGALQEEDKIYITEQVAIQFFGDENPLGNFLEIIEPLGGKHLMEIAGVIQNHPLNSSFTFDVLTNFERYVQQRNLNQDDWSLMVHALFLELMPGTETHAVETALGNYIPTFNSNDEDWEAYSFTLVPLTELASRARSIRENYLGSSNPPGTVMVPVIMALIILLVACLNYMNSMILISGKRLKEMGIRKAIGGLREQLVGQLILENVILLLFSLVLGVVLAELIIPFYNRLGPWVELRTSFITDWRIGLFLFLLFISVGAISCGYPSLYISRYNTMQIFQRNVSVGGSGRLTRVLMILQLGFSLIAMIQGITYVQNAEFQRNYNLGYNTANVMSIRLQEGSDFDEFRNTILQIHGIEMAGVAEHHMGYGNLESFVEYDDKSAQARQFNVGDTYLETLGIEVIQGRNFLKDSEVDKENVVLINQNLMDLLELKNPIDARILINDMPYYVAGVVANFFPYGLWRDESEQLAIFRLTEKSKYMAIRTSLDKENADQLLKAVWLEMFPDIPYESERENIMVYRSELLSDNMAKINLFMAIVALFLSSTGLYTLLSLNLRKRIKEIAVRRIFGATSWQIMFMVNKWFIWLTLLAIIIGSALGYVLTEVFMSIMFSEFLSVGIFSVGLAAISVLLILVFTSGSKAYKAGRDLPIESLRAE